VRGKRDLRVVLCGYYGFGNLGDELLLEALIDGLESCGVGRGEMAVLSGSPEETRARHGLVAADRWSVRGAAALLRRSETLLLGGGGIFQDATSARSPVYYWGLVRIALLAGARPWCIGQSVGPFRRALSARLARSSLAACEVRGVRDARSASLLKGWGLGCDVTCDPVISLSVPAAGPSTRDSAAGRLAVNIRPWRGDLPRRTAVEAVRIASELSLELTGLALAAEDAALMESLRDEGLFPATSIATLDAGGWRSDCSVLLSGATRVVAMRFHAAVLALLHGRDLVGVAYDPKVAELADEWGFPLWDGDGRMPRPGAPSAGLSAPSAGERFLRELRLMCDRALSPGEERVND